jgi:putative heme iron utilization protein
MKESVEEARTFIQSEHDGMLCTLSRRLEGFPFGSIAPYALTQAGEPLILISDIAEHTKNVRADARASFLIQASNTSDQQASARATLMGYAIPVSKPFYADAEQRYLEAVPGAAGYFAAHDFSLFKINVLQVRFIGGFGNIHWIDGDEIIDRAGEASLDLIAPHAAAICKHMNEDHEAAMIDYAKAFARIEADAVKMIHVDSYGFDLIAIAGGMHKPIRLDFPAPVSTTDDLRKATVEMVRRARAIVG